MEILDFIVEYPIQSLLIFIGLNILVFFIIREILCWYWKINERNKLLNEQNIILDEQNKILAALVNLEFEKNDILRKISNIPDESVDSLEEAAATEEDDPE